MKNIISAIVFMLSLTPFSFAQHIPPCQGTAHSTSICWGYATGRAFGRSWNDSRCPLSTLHFTTIPSAYFDYYSGSSLSGIQSGDIVRFAAHAAYVVTPNTNVNNIVVDQVPYDGGQEQTGILLGTVIQTQGQPLGYYRKKPLWKITVQNSFTGGNVGVDGAEYTSPYTTPQLFWETSVPVDAVMEGRIYDGYVRRFQYWQDDYSGQQLSLSKTATIPVTFYDYTQTRSYTAFFLKEFNIVFRNSFVGVGNGGVIKVNGTQYNSPTSTFPVREGTSITGEAIYQVSNGIEYLFDHWSDGSTNYVGNPYTFTPTDHRTYTAYFVGKPLPMINFGLHHVVNVGQNIHLVWNDHPNTNVTQYQIWRKVKHSSTGTTEGPTLLTTLNRGTTSWTDYDYIYTSGYTDDLLSYDVRAYYRTEGTYANESWVVGYGKQYDIAQDNSGASATVSFLPNEYSVVNYPNPFNPSTTIRYALPKDGHVMLKVYDMLGREMMTLVNEEREAGSHEVRLDGTRLGSGVYLCRITAGGFTSVMKISLMK